MTKRMSPVLTSTMVKDILLPLEVFEDQQEDSIMGFLINRINEVVAFDHCVKFVQEVVIQLSSVTICLILLFMALLASHPLKF